MQTVTVAITDDATYEGAGDVRGQSLRRERCIDRRQPGCGHDLGRRLGGPGIDDDRPALAVDNVTVTEGADPYAVFTVSLSNPSVEDVDVSLALN